MKKYLCFFILFSTTLSFSQSSKETIDFINSKFEEYGVVTVSGYRVFKLEGNHLYVTLSDVKEEYYDKFNINNIVFELNFVNIL